MRSSRKFSSVKSVLEGLMRDWNKKQHKPEQCTKRFTDAEQQEIVLG